MIDVVVVACVALSLGMFLGHGIGYAKGVRRGKH